MLTKTFSARRIQYGLVAIALQILLPIPRGLSAQDLSYITVTRMEFGGSMGMMMRMVPDMEEESRLTTYLKGGLMRTDDGESSTIMNPTEGAFTLIQHDSRTYYTMTLADMQGQMSEAQARMGQQNPMAQQGPGGEGSFEVKMSTDRTGQNRTFDGYSAEQVLLTVEMIPTSSEAQEMAAVMGRTVIFTELWISSDFPEADVFRKAQEEMADGFLGAGGAGMGSAMAQAMGGNSSMQEAMEKNMEIMKDMDGVPVRTVTHMVSVPGGMEFDARAVLAAADKPLEAGEGVSADDAAMAAAKEAMGGRLGGLLGRGKKEEKPEAPAGPARQTITMRTVSTMEGIKTESLSADLFQPPAGYTEKQPEWMRGG